MMTASPHCSAAVAHEQSNKRAFFLISDQWRLRGGGSAALLIQLTPVIVVIVRGWGQKVTPPTLLLQVVAPQVARQYAPADGRSIRRGSTSVRGRVCSPHTAKLQAASVPIACAPRAGTDRRTDCGIATAGAQ